MIWKKKISFWLWTIFLLSYWKHMTPGYLINLNALDMFIDG